MQHDQTLPFELAKHAITLFIGEKNVFMSYHVILRWIKMWVT